MNTAPNVVNTRVLFDSAEKSVIQFIGYYTTATTANTKALTSNTLSYANTSAPNNLVTVEKIQFASKCNGFVSLEWMGAAGINTAFFTSGSSAGVIEGPYAPDISGAVGDINVRTHGLNANDSFNVIVTCKKDINGGFANATAWY